MASLESEDVLSDCAFIEDEDPCTAVLNMLDFKVLSKEEEGAVGYSGQFLIPPSENDFCATDFLLLQQECENLKREGTKQADEIWNLRKENEKQKIVAHQIKHDLDDKVSKLEKQKKIVLKQNDRLLGDNTRLKQIIADQEHDLNMERGVVAVKQRVLEELEHGQKVAENKLKAECEKFTDTVVGKQSIIHGLETKLTEGTQKLKEVESDRHKLTECLESYSNTMATLLDDVLKRLSIAIMYPLRNGNAGGGVEVKIENFKTILNTAMFLMENKFRASDDEMIQHQEFMSVESSPQDEQNQNISSNHNEDNMSDGDAHSTTNSPEM